MTKEQINKKYKGKYISFTKQYDYNNDCYMYTVTGKATSFIRENTTLGEDVGTVSEYRR